MAWCSHSCDLLSAACFGLCTSVAVLLSMAQLRAFQSTSPRPRGCQCVHSWWEGGQEGCWLRQSGIWPSELFFLSTTPSLHR